MKLSYWYAECLNDGDCYSIRERTKKAAQEAKRHSPSGPQEWDEELQIWKSSSNFGPIRKVTVEYASGFDLLTQITGEGGLHEEA